jgi:hypothetical protein
MTKNVGSLDRGLRVLGALLVLAAAIWAPLPLVVRVLLVGQSAYFAWSALAGTCLGYRMMGLSTCPVKAAR